MAEEIVQEILWTGSAKITFNNIMEYLQEKWSDKEVERFVNSTIKMLSTLKHYPEMCRPSAKRKYVRIGILNKQIQLVYHYKPGKKQIKILLFWGMKQNPAKFKY